MDAVEKRKISCPCQESNPISSAVQPVAHKIYLIKINLIFIYTMWTFCKVFKEDEMGRACRTNGGEEECI
jgi:hypothetical protein